MLSTSKVVAKEKQALIAENEGFDSVDEYAEEFGYDAVSTGICTNEACEFTTEVEPDCTDGQCEECATPTVVSFVELCMITTW